MLVRSALYLANCDSVRRLSSEEISKRLTWGLVFAEKIVLTPNILIDNPNMDACLQRGIVGKYLMANPGLVVLRHNYSQKQLSVLGHFREVPEDYIVSHVSTDGTAVKKKRDLTPSQLEAIETRLARIDAFLENIQAQHERIVLVPGALSVEIAGRVQGYKDATMPDGISEEFLARLVGRAGLSSRSDWYRHIGEEFANDADTARVLRVELVDPAYNSLFIRSGEAFASDDIRRLKLPALLTTVLVARVYNRPIEVAREAIRMAQFVHSGGLSGLLGWAKEYGTEYFAEAMVEKTRAGLEGISTWARMERGVAKWIGVEIKK